MAESNKQKIKEITYKTVAEALEDIEKVSFGQLRFAARNFLEQINSLNYSFSRMTILDQIKTIKSNAKSDTAYTKALFGAIFLFEEKLNAFLGRIITLTYVTREGQVLAMDSASAEKMYTQYIQSRTDELGKGQFTFRKKNQKQKIQELQAIQIEQLNKSLEIGINNKKEVFQEALRRFEKKAGRWTEQDSDFMTYKLEKKVSNTFYWWPDITKKGKLQYSKKISNKGNIAQGYAQAVINRQENEGIKNSDIEKSLELLNDLINQNKTAGILKGDVTWSSDGRLQFAVKAASSNTAAAGQYIAMAYYILAVKELSKQDLLSKMQFLIDNKKDSAEDILNYLIDSSTQDLYKKYLKNLT